MQQPPHDFGSEPVGEVSAGAELPTDDGDFAAKTRTEPNAPPDADEAPHSENTSPAGAGASPVSMTKGEVFSPQRALEAVGDRWSLLIMREAMFAGTTRFDDFQKKFDVASDILDARLSAFVGAGLMEIRRISGAGDHFQYALTTRGNNLEPVIIALCIWSDGWGVNPGPAVPFEHDQQIAAALSGSNERPEPDEPRQTAQRESLQTEICLLKGFTVRVGGKPLDSLAAGSQRLLAFLALHDTAVARGTMAGTMWPDSSEQRAGISLRSALSRLDTPSRNTILSASAGLSLIDSVEVDLREAQAIAARLLRPSGEVTDADLSSRALGLLSSALLPDWYDDWVIAEAEDWRLLRMNALEAQSALLLKRGRFADASRAARAAIKAEPLRESATASLIRVHLAEGNQSDALRNFERYRELLRTVLDLEPTSLLTDLVARIHRT